MKPESRPNSEQGLASRVNLVGAFDDEFIQTTLAKHASFSLADLLHRSVLALHRKRLFDNAGLPTNRETARCELSSSKRQSESTSSCGARFLATVFCVGCFRAFR
jgi:hypothetical protein